MYSVERDGSVYVLRKDNSVLVSGLSHRDAIDLLKRMLMIQETLFRGEPGKDGKHGKDGVDGRDGVDGEHGKDGVDGRDGVDGKDGKDGRDGKDGKDGVDGRDGKDGRFFIKIGKPLNISSGMIWYDLEERKLKICIGNQIIDG